MATTLLDIGSGALTAIGQLGRGQSVSPEDAALILRLSNQLLEKMSTSRLMLYNVNTRTYALAPGTVDYTIGPSGTFTAARPTFIESAQVQVPGSSGAGRWETLSMLDKPQWDAIRAKDAIAMLPDVIWCEPSFPNYGFHVNPAPAGIVTIHLGCWEQLTAFADVLAPFSFPPGYAEAIEPNLAVMLAPYYEQDVPPALAARANDGLAAIAKINAQGLGGMLGDAAKFQSPNLGQPIPAAPVPGGAAPAA